MKINRYVSHNPTITRARDVNEWQVGVAMYFVGSLDCIDAACFNHVSMLPFLNSVDWS